VKSNLGHQMFSEFVSKEALLVFHKRDSDFIEQFVTYAVG